MTKIDIFSGFLGAGKTTLIKRLIADSYKGEKLVLIENEFGEIGIDGGFMQDAGIEVTEMNSGCICCSLVGDFGEALRKVLATYAPDRILIEPSGVGKLSDVIKAVQGIGSEEIALNAFTTVVDAGKCKMYMKNFGEFFNDQVEHAGTIIMSHADVVKPDKLETAVALVREKNPTAVIVTTPITELSGEALLDAIERKDTLNAAIEHLMEEQEHEHHHHHNHDHEHEHDHEHHHDHDHDHEHEHDHDHEHHHDHDHDHDHDHHHDHEHEHDHEHHHHEHGEDCTCGCHDHDHHHHHADEVFTSWGRESTKSFTKDELETVLSQLEDEKLYGRILRAKGIVPAADGSWIHFDYIPGEADVRTGSAGVIGRLCVIGAELHEEELGTLFGV
ncbi:MAG: GTP-binding protein [Clostridia bacterium]|nr:GTP-binding protein [Clostridia bacterium]